MWKFLVSCFAMYASALGYKVTRMDNRKYSSPNFPIWDYRSQGLYWVNKFSNESGDNQGEPIIFRYDPSLNTTYSAGIKGVNGFDFLILVDNPCFHSTNFFLAGIGNIINVVTWDGESDNAIIQKSDLFSIEQDNPQRRTSAGIADQNGNYIGGTYSSKFCKAAGNETLWMYGSNLGTEPFRVGEDITYTAGIQVDQNNNILYHVDPCTNQLTGYQMDPSDGSVDTSSRRVLVDFNKMGKSPKTFNLVGLTIDTTGKLYATDYNGNVLVIDSSTGKVIQTIRTGIDGVAGLTFGGINRDTLYLIAMGYRYNLEKAGIKTKIMTGGTLYAMTGLGATGYGTLYYNLDCSLI